MLKNWDGNLYLILLTLEQEIKEETFPIGHDLAWYVIKKAFSDFLITDDKGQKKLVNFYQEYVDAYGLDLGQRQIIYAATVFKMKKWGWQNEPDQYFITQASHGSKSKIQSEIEKYIWCAVHEIYAHLSDKLDLIHEGTKVKSYRERFSNNDPSEHVSNSTFFECPSISKEFHPLYYFDIETEFSEQLERLKIEIKSWIESPLNIEWGKLFQPDKNALTLSGIETNSEDKYVITNVSISNVDKTKSVRQQLFASAFLVDDELLANLINNPNEVQKWISDHYHPLYSHSASIHKWSYISPREIFHIDDSDFHDLAMEMTVNGSTSTIIPVNIEFTSNDILNGDTGHILPSPALFNETASSISSDGITTFTADGELLAFKDSRRKNYDIRQELLFQNENIIKRLKNFPNLVWFAEVEKQTITHMNNRIDLRDLNEKSRQRYMIHKDSNGKLKQLYLGREIGHG